MTFRWPLQAIGEHDSDVNPTNSGFVNHQIAENLTVIKKHTQYVLATIIF